MQFVVNVDANTISQRYYIDQTSITIIGTKQPCWEVATNQLIRYNQKRLGGYTDKQYSTDSPIKLVCITTHQSYINMSGPTSVTSLRGCKTYSQIIGVV